MLQTEHAEGPEAWSVMVHLVGHHDLYLVFDAGTSTQITRPLSPAIWSAGEAAGKALGVATAPLHTEGDAVQLSPAACIGWKASDCARRLEVRGAAVDGEVIAKAHLAALRLPLLSAALAAQRKATPESWGRALIVVSTGSSGGVPSRGQCTRRAAEVMAECVRRSTWGEGLEVHALHFETESPHHFEGLAAFVRELDQMLAGYRRRVVARHGDAWASAFGVMLSVNTGPTPVIVGLVQGLAAYRPRLCAIAEARRWPPGASEAPWDAVVLDADGVRQGAAVDAASYDHDAPVARAIAEMWAWQSEYRAARPDRPDKSLVKGARAEEFFWFRKGAQEVLAVVVVRDPADPEVLRAFRGVNLEVSLPTGSLCAERNAIGTAVATHPQLTRKDVAAVAVLSLGAHPRLGPCGACLEWLRKMAEANPDLRVVTFADHENARVFVDSVG